MENVIISNPIEFEKKKQELKKDGKEKLHILTDFDRTLTKAFIDGEKTPSVISILRNENCINEDYSKKAKELFEKYHPIEINPKINLKEKEKEMKKWWTEHFELLIKSKLNKEHLKLITKSKKIQLRSYVKEFIEILNSKEIPLIILSSAGLGKESIEIILAKNNQPLRYIYILSLMNLFGTLTEKQLQSKNQSSTSLIKTKHQLIIFQIIMKLKTGKIFY